MSTATFWDKTAERYAASPIKNMEAYEKTLERTRAHLSHDANVLEVGCGTGTTALKLAGDAAHITASDYSAPMVDIGKRKAKEQGVTNISFIQATFGDASLGDGPYDAVMAFNLLHLVEDLPAALRDVAGRLKPGGLFISKTVCLGHRGIFFRLFVPLMLLFIRVRYFTAPPFVAFFKKGDLEKEIASAGFEIIETGDYPAPNSHFIVARKL